MARLKRLKTEELHKLQSILAPGNYCARARKVRDDAIRKVSDHVEHTTLESPEDDHMGEAAEEDDNTPVPAASRSAARDLELVQEVALSIDNVSNDEIVQWPKRAIVLAFAHQQRDLIRKMKKVSVVEKKKDDVAASSSSDISSMIRSELKRVLQSEKDKNQASKSKQVILFKGRQANTRAFRESDPCVEPGAQKGLKKEGFERTSKKESEKRKRDSEIQEMRRQVRNSRTGWNATRGPEYFLKMCKNSQIEWVFLNMRSNDHTFAVE
jgi:delta 1-pyrroline-5-carboxylate dehydrogenase